jgi:hypothetical protein
MTVSTAGVLGGFIALTLFRAFFAAGLPFALAKRFLGATLATMRFAGLARADLEGLRALRRVIDFPFRTAGRFFRCAIIAACSR